MTESEQREHAGPDPEQRPDLLSGLDLTIREILESLPALSAIPANIDNWFNSLGRLPGVDRLKREPGSSLVQEQSGFHLGISPQIKATARQAAQVAAQQYQAWLTGAGNRNDTEFRRNHFTVAVGGGNTVKNEYKALLQHHFQDINWLDHVRFFFIEETCGKWGWEGAREGLVTNFLEPLARKLIANQGTRKLIKRFDLELQAPHEEIIARVVDLMSYPIQVGEIESALRADQREPALACARREARRYQAMLRELLGPDMSCHLLLSGIGKGGDIGAFAPKTPELKRKKPGVLVLEQPDGAISVAMNRGALTASDCVSLIISGSLKLRALGRFEMDDSVRFEQTVMETPIRMLCETREIAEKVYIFADDRALHFDEEVFHYQEGGETLEIKSEVREGDEEQGVHALLVHGFMGLYSYINLLIRLPASWKISALRRGKYAKTLPDAEIFPHYARGVRKMILSNWRAGRPTPVCCHSMAGVISDHLLLSVMDDYQGDLPEFDQLKGDDRKLIEALRVGGLIHIATWAPSDIVHLVQNTLMRIDYQRGKARLDFSGPKEIYDRTSEGALILNAEHREKLITAPAALEKIMNLPPTEPIVNGLNAALRYLLDNVDVQKLMSQGEMPYGLRLLSNRVLKRVSFYGVLKEIIAALHCPEEYQRRHVLALEAIVKYEIPVLTIVHRDDYMVSANRHRKEHEYLLAKRLEKEGVRRQQDLKVPAQLVFLRGEDEKPSDHLINAHFLIMSFSNDGEGNARKVTAAMTRFVDANLAGRRGKV